VNHSVLHPKWNPSPFIVHYFSPLLVKSSTIKKGLGYHLRLIQYISSGQMGLFVIRPSRGNGALWFCHHGLMNLILSEYNVWAMELEIYRHVVGCHYSETPWFLSLERETHTHTCWQGWHRLTAQRVCSFLHTKLLSCKLLSPNGQHIQISNLNPSSQWVIDSAIIIPQLCPKYHEEGQKCLKHTHPGERKQYDEVNSVLVNYSGMRPKWHPSPFTVHYFSPRCWSKRVRSHGLGCHLELIR
jgi:hypothetical protein